jgi:hypothetical protein
VEIWNKAFGQSHTRHRYLLQWLLYWVVALLLYARGNDAHFVYDSNSWYLSYAAHGVSGLWTSFGDASMHHLGHIIPFFIYKWIGHNAYIWTAILTAFHAGVTLLLFITIRTMLDLYEHHHSAAIAWLSTGLFMCSPLHTEILVWASTIWYQQSLVCVLLSMIWFIRYLHTGHSRHWQILAVTLVGYWTWEISFCIPIILLVIFILSRDRHLLGYKPLYQVVLPAFGGIGLYLVLNVLRSGHLVSHYGSAAHLNTHIETLVGSVTIYLLKLSSLFSIVGYGHRDKLILLVSRPPVAMTIMVLLGVLGLVITYFVWHRRTARLAWLLIILVVAAMAPVINIGMYYLQPTENDRYIYVATAFFYPAIVYLLYLIMGHRYTIAVCVITMLGLVYQQQQVVGYWQLSGAIQQGLIKEFKWANANRIFILLTPDNVNGAYCVRSHSISGFVDALHAQRGIDIMNKTQEIYQYNVVKPTDSISAVWIDSTGIQLTFQQWGNWFWKESFGAAPIVTQNYTATPDQWNHAFVFRPINRQPGDVYIYQSGTHWYEVK